METIRAVFAACLPIVWSFKFFVAWGTDLTEIQAGRTLSAALAFLLGSRLLDRDQRQDDIN